MINQLQTMLDQAETRQLNRFKHEELCRAQTQILEAWKLALKYKHKVPKLLAQNLKKENNEGWIYLLNWIEQVEMNSMGDQMRLYI